MGERLLRAAVIFGRSAKIKFHIEETLVGNSQHSVNKEKEITRAFQHKLLLNIDIKYKRRHWSSISV